MELLEALSPEAYVSEPCKIGQILAKISESQRVLLHSRLENEDGVWSADKLAFNLKRTAYPVGATTIKVHRMRLCGCFL
jgi:hypothetical protein